MTPRTDFPPVRACLFDMDGLLLDTEDLYTLCINLVLDKYSRPRMPWSIKAKLQGRPGPEANRIFYEWAQLPIPQDEYIKQLYELQAQHFVGTQPLPGIPRLLADLVRTKYWELKPVTAAAGGKENVSPSVQAGKENINTGGGAKAKPQRVHIALATSSHASNFHLKTNHLSSLFSAFPTARRVLGDDTRIAKGRGKPLPDIYLLALSTINSTLAPGEAPIKPEECLVFEDSVPGVEAGRRAGMRVIWCPHPLLKREYAGREAAVLAGTTGEAGDGVEMHAVGREGDGWAEYLETLVGFPYGRYGIAVPAAEVEEEECMREAALKDAKNVVQAVDGAA